MRAIARVLACHFLRALLSGRRPCADRHAAIPVDDRQRSLLGGVQGGPEKDLQAPRCLPQPAEPCNRLHSLWRCLRAIRAGAPPSAGEVGIPHLRWHKACSPFPVSSSHEPPSGSERKDSVLPDYKNPVGIRHAGILKFGNSFNPTRIGVPWLTCILHKAMPGNVLGRYHAGNDSNPA